MKFAASLAFLSYLSLVASEEESTPIKDVVAVDVAENHLGLAISNKLSNLLAVPNKLSINNCGLLGKPRRCIVNRSAFNPMFLEGDIIDIDFGPNHQYTCRSKGRGSSTCVSQLVGNNATGDMNVITRGKNSRGRATSSVPRVWGTKFVILALMPLARLSSSSAVH